MRRALLALLLASASGALDAAGARPSLDGMPKRVQDHVWELVGACNRVGGRPGDPMQAIEAADLDGDGAPDLILDEERFPCRGVETGAVCAPVGCSTYVTLSDRGRWRPALDFVGGYCLDRTQTPPQFLTIQKNYATIGVYLMNVRYRFRRGMAFQEGRGAC